MSTIEEIALMVLMHHHKGNLANVDQSISKMSKTVAEKFDDTHRVHAGQNMAEKLHIWLRKCCDRQENGIVTPIKISKFFKKHRFAPGVSMKNWILTHAADFLEIITFEGRTDIKWRLTTWVGSDDEDADISDDASGGDDAAAGGNGWDDDTTAVDNE